MTNLNPSDASAIRAQWTDMGQALKPLFQPNSHLRTSEPCQFQTGPFRRISNIVISQELGSMRTIRIGTRDISESVISLNTPKGVHSYIAAFTQKLFIISATNPKATKHKNKRKRKKKKKRKVSRNIKIPC